MAQDLQAPEKAPEMVRLWNPKLERYGEVPADKVELAKSRGWHPAVRTASAAVQGAGQGVTLGFGDELLGAANAATKIPQAIREGSPELISKAYREGRDTARDDAAEAHAQHPHAYLAGQVVGSLPAAIAVPGGIAGAAGLGAVQGLGETDSLADPKQALKDVATGAIAGAALPALAKGVSVGAKAFAPQLEGLAARTLLKSADLSPQALGVETQKEAVQLGRQALKEPGLVPPVLSRRGATADVLAENSAKTKAAAGDALSALYSRIDRGAAHISAQDLGTDIRTAAGDAVRVKPELQRHVARAIRQIHPETYDTFEKALGEKRHYTMLKLAELKKAAETDPTVGPQHLLQAQKNVDKAHKALQDFKAMPEMAYKGHALSLDATQGVLNRLRELGAYPRGAMPTAAELSVKKDVLAPAWNQGAATLYRGAEDQGGPQALEAVEKARERYGMNAAIHDAAQGADKTARKAQSVMPVGLKAGAAATVGAALGGPGGAGLAAITEPLVEHAVLPRLPRALHNAAQSSGDVKPEMNKFLGTFGRLFHSQTPEVKQKIDHKLQEMSPRYRELRAKAEKEHADRERQKPERPKSQD